MTKRTPRAVVSGLTCTTAVTVVARLARRTAARRADARDPDRRRAIRDRPCRGHADVALGRPVVLGATVWVLVASVGIGMQASTGQL